MLNPNNNAPTIFVIFGVTGDLAGRKLLPALLSLYVKKLLPQRFMIVGFARRHFNREEFRQLVREHMYIRPGQYREEDVKHFLDHMCYEQGYFDMKEAYGNLARRLAEIDDGWKQCSNKLFHLAVSPSLYETILDRLADSGLTVPCGGDLGWTRVLVEKPFGNDTETARQLDKKLANLFKEEQIFRIDHYLAKEALQNIMTFRFSNSLFEPLWNRQHIEKVHVKLLEKIDIEGRGVLYDKLGALKDVGQNHILQMLAVVAMDQPVVKAGKGGKEGDLSAAVRRERARILSRLKPISKRILPRAAVRGQYEGYMQEKGIAPDSQTETYFRLETYLNTPRWKGVPFFLEAGKALAETRAEIDVYFKNPQTKGHAQSHQNILSFRIQPDEGIKIRFWVKTPGYSLDVEPKNLSFAYRDTPVFNSLPDAYERVLRDAIVGDQMLFTSTDEVLASWKFITPIVKAWHSGVALTFYKKGAKEV